MMTTKMQKQQKTVVWRKSFGRVNGIKMGYYANHAGCALQATRIRGRDWLALASLDDDSGNGDVVVGTLSKAKIAAIQMAEALDAIARGAK